ncbi:MAG: thioredoxin family protein [Pseudomonadota bacterium]
MLAALVASPCTAPFMGAALGYALTQDALTAFAVFAALGVGFAAPIVLLSTSPAMARLAPKPGAWMIRFRQALSFPMFLAAAWLFWVLANQAGVDALFAALAGAVALSFAAWALGVGFPDGRFGRWAAGGAAAVAILCAALALTPLQGGVEAGASNADARQASEDARSAAIGDPTPFAAARLAAFRAEGRTVFLNVTADWCVSCKVNELNVLNGERFETLLAQADAAYMLGDWTLRDEAITDLLRGFGRIGVPLYVVYPGDGGAPRVLPQILTLGIVSDGLGLEAEPRRADGAVGGAAASPG